MKISVIITNYNYAAFLSDCIDSVLAQTYPDVECIVVDDGSTDESQEIMDGYRNIRVVRHRNMGQARSCIAGMGVALGDVLLFLDADDKLDKTACECIVSSWRSGTVGVSYRLAVINEKGELTGRSLPAQPFIETGAAEFIFRFGDIPVPPNSGNAYLKTAVQEVVANATGLVGNTIDCWLHLSAPLIGEVVYLTETLGYYRIHSRNISNVGRGLDFRGMKWLIFNFYWAQETARRISVKRGLGLTGYPHLLGPYYIKYYLLVGDFPLAPYEIPLFSRSRAAREAISEFAFYPFVKLRTKLTNIIAIVVILMADRRLRVWLARKLYGIDVRSPDA